MNLQKPYQNIALVGLWKTGKSRIARLLASVLRRREFGLINTDDLLRDHFGHKELAEILRDHGEDEYRKAEAQVVSQLAVESKKIISTGGTLVMSPTHGTLQLNTEAIESLKPHAFVVVLLARPETILANIRENPHRPIEFLGERLDDNVRQVAVEWTTQYRSVAEGFWTDLPNTTSKECAEKIIRRLKADARCPQDWFA